MENFTYAEINEPNFSNPHPGLVDYNHAMSVMLILLIVTWWKLQCSNAFTRYFENLDFDPVSGSR